MALVSWPSTLPIPSTSFSFSHKKMGNTLTFGSGRRRVTQTRMLPFDPSVPVGTFGANLLLLNVSMSFVLTLPEYLIFAEFYDERWKRFTPQEDRLSFAISGYGWEGWPTSAVKTVRNDNTWSVSFDFECFVDYDPFMFSSDETDSVNPMWPVDEFDFNIGAKFSRASRDSMSTADNLLLSRTVVPDDNFVVGEISLRQAPISRIFRFVSWWLGYCRAGALPFKLPATNLDLGQLNGVLTGPTEFYKGKILGPPEVSFDSYFGTASVSVVLCPYATDVHASALLISNTGAWFVTDTGNHLLGVY